MSTTQQLKNIVSQLTVSEAPRKTERCGDHVEVLVAIGRDNTATITMHKDDYEALMAQDWE